jgi:hypothetical protein
MTLPWQFCVWLILHGVRSPYPIALDVGPGRILILRTPTTGMHDGLIGIDEPVDNFAVARRTNDFPYAVWDSI